MGKELSDKDVIEYNLQVLPTVKDIEPTYSIVARARNYSIRGGDNIEIDIYLTGLGIPEENKLVLLWSSPNIIDTSSKGVLTSCIKFSPAKLKGKDTIVPVSGKSYVDHFDLDPNGVTVHLNNGYFLPVPKFSVSNGKQALMAEMMAEKQFDGARGSHDWEHTLRVVRLCEQIGLQEDVDPDVLLAAGYLHDIGRSYQDSAKGAVCHAEKGAQMAAPMLAGLELSALQQDNICHCIRSHRFRS